MDSEVAQASLEVEVGILSHTFPINLLTHLFVAWTFFVAYTI